MSGCDRRRADLGIVTNFGERFQCHVGAQGTVALVEAALPGDPLEAVQCLQQPGGAEDAR